MSANSPDNSTVIVQGSNIFIVNNHMRNPYPVWSEFYIIPLSSSNDSYLRSLTIFYQEFLFHLLIFDLRVMFIASNSKGL